MFRLTVEKILNFKVFMNSKIRKLIFLLFYYRVAMAKGTLIYTLNEVVCFVMFVTMRSPELCISEHILGLVGKLLARKDAQNFVSWCFDLQ